MKTRLLLSLLDIDVRVNYSANSADDVELNPWVVGVGVSYRF